MEPLECRHRAGSAFAQLLLLLVSELLVGALGASWLRPGDRPALVFGAWTATLLAVGFLAWRRWRSRFVIDDRGVEFRRSKRGSGLRVEWDEVEEVFLLGPAAVELRGAGKRMRLGRAYSRLALARDRIARRMGGIRERLRARALVEGRIDFRMPWGAWKAHLSYLAAVLVLTGITGLCLAPLFEGRIFGYPMVFVFFGGGWLWGLRKKASVLGTRVTLQREGILVRRLDGRDRIAWEDLDRAEWSEGDGLNLVLRSCRVVPLPPSLGNIVLLEEFLRERPVDSGSRGQAGNRSMLQSP